jgi:hypothetical protein
MTIIFILNQKSENKTPTAAFELKSPASSTQLLTTTALPITPHCQLCHMLIIGIESSAARQCHARRAVTDVRLASI